LWVLFDGVFEAKMMSAEAKRHLAKLARKRKRPVPPPAYQVTAARQATGLSGQLLTRHQIVALTGFTYPWIWQMMMRGEFPRSRTVGGKSMWLTSELNAWLANLPKRRLKGDAPLDQNIEEAARVHRAVGTGGP
jgi:predicted DNA-binding transcriptional regulator AlpA